MAAQSPVEGKSRFDPVDLTDEDLEDLATFFGMSREACLDRLRAYSATELEQQWRATSPTTPQDILGFYREADGYIWELMQWNACAERRYHRQALEELVRRYPADHGWQKVLDFGCGVGTDSLFLARHGYAVTLVDVDGPGLRFAKHRFERRGLPARFVVSTSPLPVLDMTYDIVLCFDVFEHLMDPLSAAARLAHGLRPGGILLQVADFSNPGDIRPCHLPENVARFSGMRWHIHLAGLGLRTDGHPMRYRRAAGIGALAQRARYVFWRLTRIWPLRVPRQDVG